MEDTKNKAIRVVDGFSFHTNQDADLADLERKKIAYLEARMDYANSDSILRIYEKAIKDKVFKTPVGIYYLKHLRDYLLEQEDIAAEDIEPIPLVQTFSKEPKAEKTKEEAEQKPKKSAALSFSVILNLLLGAAVVAMFAIALNASQPNILNYEKVITNRYATWEQELTEREQAVREKERELKIEVE